MSVVSSGSEYDSLRRELDPELRGEGLLALAGRQLRESHGELASATYSGLLEDAALPASVRERAQSRLGALQGNGPIAARAEVLLSHFAEEASNPTMLLAMTVAGVAFRATRLLTLSRLAASPTPLIRGFGARALAGLAGFGVEATVFPLAARAGNLALGREQEWSGRALGREIASSLLTLGALRAGGFAARSLAGAQSWYRPAVEQLGMFGGIVLGHGLEVRADLRNASSGANMLVDSLATLLQFNVAGRLNRSLMGEGLQRWELRAEAQTEALSRVPESRWPNLPSLGASPALAGAGHARPSFERPETIGPDTVFMSQEGDNGNNGRGKDFRTKTTIPGLTRPSLLPQANRHPLFLENKDYRILNLSLRTREIRPPETKGHIQGRVLMALEEYLRVEKDPVVLIYPENTSFDNQQQGALRVDLYRFFREFNLPESFNFTVLVPADNAAIHFAKNTKGALEITTRPFSRRSESHDSGQVTRTEVVAPRLPRADSSELNIRAGSRPDPGELKSGMERLIGQVISDIEQNPSLRLTRGRIGIDDLESFAPIFSSNTPPSGRRFTVLWVEKGGGKVEFQREGEAIRAEWKGYQSAPQVFWYIPSRSALGQFQFYPEGQWTSYAWEADPGYSQGITHKLRSLWSRVGVVGDFEQAGNREEGSERQGTILARIAQQWLSRSGGTDKTWDPLTLQNLVEIHQILEGAEAHLNLALVRRFQERLGSQNRLKYETIVTNLPRRSSEGRLVPLSEFDEGLLGVPYLPPEGDLRAAFVRQLFHVLQRPRFPMENNRFFRDPRRMGEIYRETLRGRILPLMGAMQLVKKGSPNGDVATLLRADLDTLNASQAKQRGDIEFFLTELPEYSRVFRLGNGMFHREFLRSVFQGDRSILAPYLLMRQEIERLPEDLRTLHRVKDLPTRQEIEAHITRPSR